MASGPFPVDKVPLDRTAEDARLALEPMPSRSSPLCAEQSLTTVTSMSMPEARVGVLIRVTSEPQDPALQAQQHASGR